MKRYLLAFAISALALGAAVSCQKDNDDDKAVELSSGETANCYVVSAKGTYSFPAVKGNSSEPVGAVSTAEVLWESFGNNEEPNVGDLVSNARYKDGKIIFDASEMRGNAVIAAKDASGTILWSWHIWLTDKPREQVYNNDAGIMMDRNLGATTATPQLISSFGLMYQWGRKDPFRGVENLDIKDYWNQPTIVTTSEWPEAVVSDRTTGTVGYAVANPMTFIIGNENNEDWLYGEDYDTDNTRWQSEKTVYDPCPAGWRVPDGGPEGIWVKAFGTEIDYFESAGGWDTGLSGVDFSKTDIKLATAETVWYPNEGLIYCNRGILAGALQLGGYWSVTTRSRYGYVLAIIPLDKAVMPYQDSPRAHGCSVRCMKIR